MDGLERRFLPRFQICGLGTRYLYDRDEPVETELAREIDPSHPAGTEESQKLVTRHGWHFFRPRRIRIEPESFGH